MWPLSVDDVKVFAYYTINKKLRNGKLPLTFQSVRKNQVKVSTYSIGGPSLSLSSLFVVNSVIIAKIIQNLCLQLY